MNSPEIKNMAAPVNNRTDCWSVPEVYKHHEQQKVCISRPKYREGRRAKAVKVYTINLESCYVMVQGVPAIGVMTELVQLCALYGTVEEYRPLDEYPAEEFTEVYLVRFQKITSARAAKRHMDEKSFYGGVLHVCYAPEYESVEDTRRKLQDRRGFVMRASRCRAKEKATREGPKSTEAANTSYTADNKHALFGENANSGEASYAEGHSDFPPLPLPPREHFSHLRRTEPTEDRMGTLYGAVPDRKESQRQSSSMTGQVTEQRLASNPVSGIRFVPRTTNLVSRKRNLEPATEDRQNASETNEPLIGPRLPEPPKVDMEDESLNTTVSLIRSTLKQMGSAPDLKPVEKKIKARRRI